MTFHPAVFNLTVVDPSLYPGLHGGQHPFFQAPQQPQNPHLPPHLPNRVPGAAPGLPSQHLEGGAEDTHFQTFVHSLPSELQGPIAFRNDTRQAPFAKPRPVIPRLAIPAISNSTFVQLPVLWTALSLALGVEVQGEVIRGLPCIKRLNQLFCRTPGTPTPRKDKIERFIEDNKALMRRMYGSFFDNIQEILEPQQQRRFLSRPGRSVREDEAFADEIPEIHKEYHPDDPRGQSFFNLIRRKRQSFPGDANSNSDRVDSCESKVEIVTPYWANNSAGKIRAIVNTNEFSQAIHQEVCAKQSTKRCGGDCGCEQKYKWHRLLAYDPDNDCSGIFMDWFLFPSCCSCRCNPL
ncbi:protein spaetzle 3-like [Portunus trituberculatus]|uniref:protein spaetzle 3-like n=1 Tax=Portunus trituberculatus TaxID=210409 RepID=UPI001E1CBC37|nr:protein spaetzle 3-like [Portunus trituberculatus]